MKRDAAIDVSRCFMNYMIVLLHAWAAFQYVPWDTLEFKFWTFTCSHLACMAMPCFFLISGYLLFQQYTLASWPNKMLRRVKRLFVPYVAWNVFFVVFYLMMSHFVPRLATRVASFGIDTFSGAFSKILSFSVGPIDGPLWFIRTIFLLALISPVLYFIMKKVNGVLLFLLLVAWIAVKPWIGISEPFSAAVPTFSYICFIVGGLLALHGVKISAFFSSWWWVVLGLSACIVRAILIIPTCMTGEPLGRLVACIESTLFVFEAPTLLALTSHLPVGKICTSKVFYYFKDLSFFAYAGHFLFCSMVLHTVASVLKGHWMGKMTVLVALFFFVGIAIMAGVYTLGKRLLPRVTKIFDGTL